MKNAFCKAKREVTSASFFYRDLVKENKQHEEFIKALTTIYIADERV